VSKRYIINLRREHGVLIAISLNVSVSLAMIVVETKHSGLICKEPYLDFGSYSNKSR